MITSEGKLEHFSEFRHLKPGRRHNFQRQFVHVARLAAPQYCAKNNLNLRFQTRACHGWNLVCLAFIHMQYTYTYSLLQT